MEPRLNSNNSPQTLKTRRIMMDLITCYKRMSTQIDADYRNFPIAANVTETRANSRKTIEN